MRISLTLDSASTSFIDLTADQVAEEMKRPDGIFIDGAQEGYLCYMGPCSNGYRTVCYHTDGGCNACRREPC